MKLDIVIVNWNTGELLANCLRSLAVLPPAERALIDRVWVIDNASSDSSVALARNPHPVPVEFIINKKNVGFAAANNQALRQIERSHHVLLLNPDTEVRPNALAAALAVFGEKSDVGIVGPRLVNPDGSQQGSVRPFPQFYDFIFYMLKLGRVIQSRQEGQHNYDQAGYVEQVMGAAFLIRNKVREHVGLLDEQFFVLFEEVDYARRAQEAGWRSWYTPAGEIMHVRAASFDQLVGFARSIPWLKSSLHYAGKYLAAWQVVVLYTLVPVSLLLLAPASVKHFVIRHVR